MADTKRGILLVVLLAAMTMFVLLSACGTSASQTHTLTLRVPGDKYDPALFEQKVSYSSPNGAPIASKITQTAANDTIVFVDAQPGTVMTVDNRGGDFTGSDMIEFADGMRRAKNSVRLTEAKAYSMTAI